MYIKGQFRIPPRFTEENDNPEGWNRDPEAYSNFVPAENLHRKIMKLQCQRSMWHIMQKVWKVRQISPEGPMNSCTEKYSFMGSPG